MAHFVAGRSIGFVYFGRTVASALLLVVAIASSCAVAAPRRPSELQIQKHDEAPEFAGRCPSDTPGYRKDLREWRYGDERDFQCFILDEY